MQRLQQARGYRGRSVHLLPRRRGLRFVRVGRLELARRHRIHLPEQSHPLRLDAAVVVAPEELRDVRQLPGYHYAGREEEYVVVGFEAHLLSVRPVYQARTPGPLLCLASLMRKTRSVKPCLLWAMSTM
ncbi:hypothetical protein VDGL01_12279 [Verticillium dahliae]